MVVTAKPARRMGRYETLRKIAAGGMATVYVGRAMGPAGFERLVAVKVMHEHIAEDPEFSAMFLDEARLAARIRHPNVVPTLDVAEDGHYIVMDLVEGASLRDVLYHRRDEGLGPMPVSAALRIILDTLEGLQAAHTLLGPDGNPLNIVHRDISPHNILVGIDGISRITDFGIAYAEARLTQTASGQLKGKMPYMAPEQLEGHALDQRVDVYAAGCVLWEMLVGKRLFAGPNEAALAVKVLQGPTVSPRQHNPEVPPEIDEVCMRALASKHERFASAFALIEALEDASEKANVRVARPRTVAAFTEGIRFELTPDDHAAASSLPISSDSQSGLRKPGSDGMAPTVPVGAATEPDPLPPTTDLNTARGLGPETMPETRAPSTHTGPVGSHELPVAARPVAVGGANTSSGTGPKSQTLISTTSTDGDENTAVSDTGVGEAVSASRVLSSIDPVPAPPLRRRSWSLALFAVAALVAGGAGALWWTDRNADETSNDKEVATEAPRDDAATEDTQQEPAPADPPAKAEPAVEAPTASATPSTMPTPRPATHPLPRPSPTPNASTPAPPPTPSPAPSPPPPPAPDPDSPSTFHPGRP